MRRIWERLRYDLLIVDHLADVAQGEGKEDYQTAIEAIWESLPAGEDRPAVCIIPHPRKLRGGEFWRPKTGRELLSELSGSFVIGAKARSVFILQPVTMDLADDRVVFDCAKANNNQAPKPMTCWRRRHGRFEPVTGFDFDSWLYPPDEGRNVTVSDQERVLREALANGRRVKQSRLAEEVGVKLGKSLSSVHRWILRLKELEQIKEEEGLLLWAGA